MRLTWRDGGRDDPGRRCRRPLRRVPDRRGTAAGAGPRALAAVLLALGLGACIVGARDVSPDTNKTPYVRAMSTLGGTAFVAALITLITGWAVALAVLAGTMAVLWVTATVRRLVTPAQRPVADRSRQGTNEAGTARGAGVAA